MTGEVEGKQEEADAHPWVATAHLEVTRGGGATRSSGSPTAVLAAPALRRHWPAASARGVEYNEAEAAVHAVVAVMARSYGNATSMELRGGFHGGSVFTS
jgi:hypothetical protein